MKFNEKLMELRKKSGLSQEELGEKLNVTRQTISKWELGQTTPEMEKLKEMASFFQISVDELLNENEIVATEEPIQTNESEKSKKGWIIAVIIIAVILLLVYLVPMLLVKDFFSLFTGNHPDKMLNTFEKGTQLFMDTVEKAENKMQETREKLNQGENVVEDNETLKDIAENVIEQATEQYKEATQSQKQDTKTDTNTKTSTKKSTSSNTKEDTQLKEINKQIEETKKKVEEQTKQHQEQYDKIKAEIENKQKQIQSMIY